MSGEYLEVDPPRRLVSTFGWERVPLVRLVALGAAGARGRRAVLLVGDVPAPRDGAARLVVLLHRDVDHEPVRGGAVPVVLLRLEEHAVARADDLDLAALALAQAH